MSREAKLTEARELVKVLIDAGVHQRVINQRLRGLGLPTFRYEQRRHQGAREMQKRRVKNRLCESGCGHTRVESNDLCLRCLCTKWGLAD